MKADLPKRLGKRVSELRRQRDYTQEQLAERCGFTVKFISRIERGIVNVPLSTLGALAGALGVTVSQLTLGIEGGVPRDVSSAEQLYAGRPIGEQAAIARVFAAMAELLAEAKKPE